MLVSKYDRLHQKEIMTKKAPKANKCCLVKCTKSGKKNGKSCMLNTKDDTEDPL